ncbi:MAG: hypothetical protein WD267_07620 [Balneolales bacterium]
MTYHIRAQKGYKFAEFDSKNEARNYLSKKPLTGLEVWTLDEMPGELLEIVSAVEFAKQSQV